MKRRLFFLTALGCGSLLTPRAWARPEPARPRPRPPAGGRGVQIGALAPSLSVTRIAGADDVTLRGLSGRVVVLDFWATWCGPCRAIMPALNRLHHSHHARGLTVLGMSSEAESAIRSHLGARPVEYTIARDIGGTASRYGVRAIPTVVVLGRRGKVREVMVGVDGSGLQRLDTLITQLLAEPSP